MVTSALFSSTTRFRGPRQVRQGRLLLFSHRRTSSCVSDSLRTYLPAKHKCGRRESSNDVAFASGYVAHAEVNRRVNWGNLSTLSLSVSRSMSRVLLPPKCESQSVSNWT